MKKPDKKYVLFVYASPVLSKRDSIKQLEGILSDKGYKVNMRPTGTDFCRGYIETTEKKANKLRDTINSLDYYCAKIGVKTPDAPMVYI